ncbi:Cellobiose phosphorylase [Limihaloglobus sulfuriphilus]|uniref:Cellobiose phosphorylase n=1 Tax=Limihaloglobus sulfuriphilus TaxID=1851148 RepID=A0A1Q2MIP8_9BACT|nr:glycoside hydrolase family 94 protein [Limihaloglobus sulfuriphilus]AQQ72550.1 Cellobiose phosphorylase [Limihaloglobus sulfuriphilus]
MITKSNMSNFSFRWKNWKDGRAASGWDPNELPLRAELFTSEQLTLHAKTIAETHDVAVSRGPNNLLARLDQNEETLRDFNLSSLELTPEKHITPAAEWLLDNFYLIEEQIQMARRHLPRGYNRGLPRLTKGHSEGLPRVYDIVLEFISHVDAQIDAETLESFIAAYQEIAPLKLGELWAIPIMLRLGLIENLKRITNRLMIARKDSELANMWVDRLQNMEQKNPSHFVVVVADMAKTDIPLSSSFVAEFCKRLSRHSPTMLLARNWLEQRLGEQGLSIEQLIHLDTQNQAADQVSVSHSIASFRALISMDWKQFVEDLSKTEQILRTDPANIYHKMDFSTRDRYRHSVEFFANHTRFSEIEVSRAAVKLAAHNAERKGPDDRTAHVGYYLIDKGQALLGHKLKLRWPLRTLVQRTIKRFPLTYYAGGIGLLTLLGSIWFARQAQELGVHQWELVFFTLTFVLCVSQLAVSTINWLSTIILEPATLPRLDYKSGIEADCRTMVVVPTMLTSADGIDKLLENMEIHYLANRDDNLHFALLTDLKDAPEEVMPDDQYLIQMAEDGVNTLNRKYPCKTKNRFFLFHRPRRWNPGEGVWMGYERKRGKLEDLNNLLRGGRTDGFSVIAGNIDTLPKIKYVITLDTDTQLPRDAARLLVGTMAHPLNLPRFDSEKGIVTEGYGIMQPRVGVSLPTARTSWFVRLNAVDVGIDPYTLAVSDVYQDVFNDASFIGKGIYDVDAFQRAMAGRFPENIILSHDLLESCHARCALVTDVELYEEFPSRFNVDAGRRHRWIRGDWQIARWLLPKVKGGGSQKIKNPLSGLSQWKIFDNLRRSLVPVAFMILMLGHWLIIPEVSGLGPLLVIGIIILPGLLSALADFLRKPKELPWTIHVRTVAGSFVRQLCQVILILVFLPYEALLSLDAIIRTIFRLTVTHKNLLQWQVSSELERKDSLSLRGFYVRMWIEPVIAAAMGLFLTFIQPSWLYTALPLFLLWTAAPLIAWWISRPIKTHKPELSAEQFMFLRKISRQTWSFFETFVTEKENWLPPDNFQEVPKPTIAHRTSPTNMGLALLANLAARDFGYVSMDNMIQRTRNTLNTMTRLKRYWGHFYNWYDTKTLRPLLPRYISSVDSGNLAGHLLTLASGLRLTADENVFSSVIIEGLRDSVFILVELDPDNDDLKKLDERLSQTPSSLAEIYELVQTAENMADGIKASNDIDQAHQEEFNTWIETLRQNCRMHLDEMLVLAPWLDMPSDVLCIEKPHIQNGSDHEQTDGPASDSAVSRLVQNLDRLNQGFSLRDAAGFGQNLCALIDDALGEIRQDQSKPGRCRNSLTELAASVRKTAKEAAEYMQILETLALSADQLGMMDFSFLFEPSKDLFATGFDVNELRRDTSYYDLLASEARLCSYITIAMGQVPQEHWFSLGRVMTASRGRPILVSWSGSMFEYLMPLLVMPNYEDTLLDNTCKAAVEQHIKYGRLRGVPWGISESGYNSNDVHLNYQYRAFGVPGLGLKRGLAEDLVIAPYATVMALMVAPQQACQNLQRLQAEGRCGLYGLYEAVDYTPSRLPPDETSVTIRSFMAHHQGMSFLSLLSVLRDAPMQRRFMASALLKANDLLLQERIPKTAVSVFAKDLRNEETRTLSVNAEAAMRVFKNPNPPIPEVHLLSNGRYNVVVSSAGGGYSRWNDLAVTRWKEDSTRDCWGTFVYLRDLESGEFWSTAYQPTVCEVKNYEAIFMQARAEFRQHLPGLEVHTELSVSPEDDVELRRITITNRAPSPRDIELTSYAEVVLALPEDDAAHPAFSNLFVQTEFEKDSSAVLCTRRARSEEETPPWLLHMMVGHGVDMRDICCETDRSKFVGRGRNLASPAAMTSKGPLSNTCGSVLDPIVSLRGTVTVPPHGKVTVSVISGVTATRQEAIGHIQKYQSPRMTDRAFDLAWTHSQVTLHQLSATEAEAQIYGRLASALIYTDPARRAAASILRRNRKGQSGLWTYGISGDCPIVLLFISDTSNTDIIRQLIQAHSYWRIKGLTVELVIINQDITDYRQSLKEQITSLIASGTESHTIDKPGGIFVRQLEHIPNEDMLLLQSAARIVLSDEKGTLVEQLKHRSVLDSTVPEMIPTRPAAVDSSEPLLERELIFNNGFGGFTPDGSEYVITVKPGRMTPAPWVNVIAGPAFGTVVSESGSAYTWVENSHEFRLTTWSNDPVQDTAGEALYIRDQHTGQFWSPTPLPAGGSTPYVIRHGFGYTVFEHTENGIESELWIYVAIDAPVKFSVLKLRNVSDRPRRISVNGYWEWVLGDLRENNLLHVQTEVDLKTGALLARNFYNTEFRERIAFVDVQNSTRTVTGDRKEFIGRNGNLANPASLKRDRLSNKTGAGMDPCGAVQVAFDLPVGQVKETCFRLGVGRSKSDVRELINRFRRTGSYANALDNVRDYWSRTLGAVNVDTPDPAVNVLANGWLMYQTISSRIWGRTGFYQSGGAFGFRDQLQDVMAAIHAAPELTRSHLLRAAAHQFRNGDVQHWWHPPAGRGVRTHFSDDYLWLPYATCRYVACVADTGVLDEKVHFLEGRLLNPKEEAYYDLPSRSDDAETLYSHCVRAIEYGLKFGEHGLPLIGCGDWNDGMNLVGHQGRGESVWLAFFLYDVLIQFSQLALSRHDNSFAHRCISQAAQLKENIERHGWDGQWYRRAYFDNGSPLGSHSNPECQIDSIPQSWSVISGYGETLRSEQAMKSVEKRLVKRDTKIIQLFDPPFDKSDLNPGYIKGYMPGVRENGGQYTHAAVWSTMAFAMLGKNELAWELFNMINPVNHGSTPQSIATYKVEPYVVAADVYGVAPHEGRGGWTWYTGSAGWMYRLIVETLLGLNLEVDKLRLEPRMPKTWDSFKIHYRYRQTVYHIEIARIPQGSADTDKLSVDGIEMPDMVIPLKDDRVDHHVSMKIRSSE